MILKKITPQDISGKVHYLRNGRVFIERGPRDFLVLTTEKFVSVMFQAMEERGWL